MECNGNKWGGGFKKENVIVTDKIAENTPKMIIKKNKVQL